MFTESNFNTTQNKPDEIVSAEMLETKQEEIIETLRALDALPDDWVSDDGLSKADVITQLQELHSEITEIIDSSEANNISDLPSDNAASLEGSLIVTNNIVKKFERPAKYLTIAGVHITVCESVKKSESKWNAAPGSVFVSGGKKFANVSYTKDFGGLTHTAKPGELMTFSEQHRNKRLEFVDTVLEGRKEILAFKILMEKLGELAASYDQLNPDDETYDEKAQNISSELLGFLDPESLANTEIFQNSGVDDIEDFSERVADILKVQQFLRDLDGEGGEFIPENNKKYKLTPYFQSKLAEYATLLNRQLGLGNNGMLREMVDNNISPEQKDLEPKGITIIVGPRGTGKNQLTDYYCNISNRPLFRYACSPDKEERDLTYDIELSEGSVVRIPTRILTAITTPNAVLELDELNLLRPNVAKFFNSLFDGDRAVFLNDQVIKAAPGVIIVGLMNNADYDGVEDLPDTIDDRANIMTMGYPPLRHTENRTGVEKFSYDEALILKDNIAPLKELPDQKFIEVWEYVVNNVGSVAGLDEEIIDIINDLKSIILIANRTRQVTDSYKKRTDTSIRLERDISLRGSIETARYYSENQLWKADLPSMAGWKHPWNAAQYAIAMTYLPHTDTYKRGASDKKSISLILNENI